MKKKIFMVAAVITSSHLNAQIPQHQREDTSYKTLDEVIFTAEKYSKKQSETGKVVSVINLQQLQRSSGKTVGEILNTTSGLTIIGANNNLGTNQTVSIRGASAGNVLILVDGIPLNDPSVITNYFDLNFFTVEQLEKIEILKGGQSTLYGSDAVAGVINLFTRKPALKLFGLQADITGGSYATFKEHVGISGSRKKMNYSLQYTHISSDGFSTAFDSSGNKNFDKDRFNQHVLSGNISVSLTKNLTAVVSSQYNFYKTSLDAAAFTDEKDFTVNNYNYQTSPGLIYRAGKTSVHINYQFNYVRRFYLDDSTYRSDPYFYFSKSKYIGRTHFAEIYGTRKWNNWEWVGGIDLRHNNTDQDFLSMGTFGPFQTKLSAHLAKMTQVSAYSTMIYHKRQFAAEGGGRWNHHSTYGSNFTYTLNPSYLLNNKLKVFVNLYSAFKTPTLYQLFDAFAGNKNLKPEKTIVTEAGTEFFQNKFRLRITGFYGNTRNAIQYIITDPSTFSSQYRNISRQENYGVETDADFISGNWNFKVNYTYTDGKTKSGYDETGAAIGKDTTFYNLYRIPKNALNLIIGLQVKKNLYINASTHIRSKRIEQVYGSTPKTLRAYYTIDFYMDYKFWENFKLFADLKNITDQQYFEILGYNSRRFNFNIGLTFKI